MAKEKKQPKVEVVKYRTFNSIEQVLKTAHCTKGIKEAMNGIMEARKKIHGEIKRNPWNFLNENELWNVKELKREYIEVAYKRSQRTGTIRTYIDAIVAPAIRKTVIHFTKEDH